MSAEKTPNKKSREIFEIEPETDEDGLTPDEYERVENRAKKRALYLLGIRAYTTEEIRRKMLLAYPKSIADNVVEYLLDIGYLDDEDYAVKFARSLIENKKKGVIRAKYEMLQKGLSPELVETVLEDYDEETIQKELLEFIEKKYKRQIEEGADIRKILQALGRRGYTYSQARQAIKTYLENLEEDSEEDDL